ncbi:hypothetical protein [Methylosinus sp. Ce-a6]|uniref:hypothetical protein n=1 Tax=Methylosinus sp. Ce-a6 TaxID=2172005 RepID=UPI001358C20C|nr:hypothetical protein [Methylosinus sp. Ce-a6]
MTKIGFKVDESSYRRFSDALESATKKAVALGAAVEAAAATILVGVEHAARGFEKLAYAAEKTGVATKTLKELQYAATQLGSSVDDATASVDALTRKMRQNPGYGAWLKNFGVHLQNGQLTARNFVDLGNALRAMPEARRLMFGAELGLSEDFTRALISGEFATRLREAEGVYSKFGVDLKATSERGREFERVFNAIGLRLEAMKARILDRLFGADGVLRDFGRWLDANGPKLADALASLAEWLIKAAKWLGEIVLRLAEWADSSDKWLSKITGVENAFAKLAAVVTALAVTSLPLLLARMVALTTSAAFAALTALLSAPWALALLGVGGIAAANRGATLEDFKRGHMGDHGLTTDEPKNLLEWGKRAWRRRPKWLGGEGAPDNSAKGVFNRLRGADAFFDAVIAAEGTGKYGDPYNASLGYLKSPKPLTSMTLDEALAWGNHIRKNTAIGQRTNSSALGAFQIVGSTLRAAMKALGLKGSDTFSPEVQRRIALWILRTQGLSAWEGFKAHPEQRRRALEALRGGGRPSSAPGSNVIPAPWLPGTGISPNGSYLPPTPPPGATPNVSNDNSRALTINAPQTLNVTGAFDAQEASRHLALAGSRMSANLLRNLQGAAQ